MARMPKIASALAFGAALLAPLAAADEDRMYGSATLQYVFYDDARPVANDFGFNLAFGIPVTDWINLELEYMTRSADGVPAGTMDQTGYALDGLFFIGGRDGRMDPYFLVGLGTHTDDFGPVDDDYTSISLGFGVIDAITENLAFRGELRLYDGDNAAQTTDVAIGLGLIYYFGDVHRTMAPAMSATIDTDGDGVMDNKDQCPGTAAGSRVDALGCVVAAAAAPVVMAAPVDPDTDGDGVKDSSDQCPNTPKGVAVMANGCAPDTDGDGVKDPQDECPGTPAGTKVLNNGCPVPVAIKLEGVTFETNSDVITAGSKAKLDEAVATLKANPTVNVEVAGHTDGMGDADKNRALSQRRADAVRKYLVDGGVAADQVTAKGYGEDEPVASNDTAEGRAQNRRVELRVKK